MSDFTVFKLELNTGTLGAPVWTTLGTTTSNELRFSDSPAQGAVASASWPFMVRPGSGTTQVNYQYAQTADATSLGYLGTSSPTPAIWSNSNYLSLRANWDTVGTFASFPIFTSYPSTGHGTVTPGDLSINGGSVTDTGGTGRSYMKGNAYGVCASGVMQVPAAAPGTAPLVTHGAIGTVSAGTAAWLATYQDLQCDVDYITLGSTGTNVVPNTGVNGLWYLMATLFTGANMLPGTFQPTLSIKYTWT